MDRTAAWQAVAVLATAVLLVQCSPAPPHLPPATMSSALVQAPASVNRVTAADLGATWRPGCPVGPEQLRRVELDYLGFDGQPHRGALVVHEDLVPQVIAIFEQLYRMGYPIERMRTVDHYSRAEDELSMADNNTSAFNCRGIPGSAHWSLHAYGRAIDLNPLLNPYLDGADLEPANAARYLDRTRTDPGLLHENDPAVRAFTDRGWQWGGAWRSPIDYQHFEKR
ncbi:M15 family metallopeptidase [Mycobacterium sp. 141]|uniref:M15 family metallopeptidase n=1 Tax=Mycobacterium sp. 141 TaxID=1120797 RepID=UPI00037C48AC|nr:M15 family metallopeptidase [Mycobacterium sp. 141]